MTALQQFKFHVTEQYRLVLGLELIDVAETGAKPTWIADNDQAWLLDEEVGLALRIVPYVDSKQDLNEAIQNALRFATLLQPRAGARAEDVDRNGMWQVGILWLVDKPALGNAWRTAIASARKESGFSEEIGLDAVLIEDDKTFTDACSRHGLPQLMLYTRKLLGLERSQMPRWLSANSRVSEMLETFPDRFSADAATVELVNSLIADALQSESTSAPEDGASRIALKRQSLEQIEIKNFRNISRCHLQFPKDAGRQTQAHIIFGPNGTGKTSIFEALCLSIGGASKTWSRFSTDTDVEARTRDYVGSVLSPLRGNEKPEISLNGAAIQIRAAPHEDPSALDGNFLGQGDTREFLSDNNQNLGQRILKGYSTLADRITQVAVNRERAANNEKAAWLKQHGLNPSIKRRETRTQRLIESEIQREGFAAAQSLLDWLDNASLSISSLGDDGVRLAGRWRTWATQQSKIVEQMAAGALLGEADFVKSPLAGWLSARNRLLTETKKVLGNASSHIGLLRERLMGVEKELDNWGEWLARQSTARPTSNTEERELLRQIEHDRLELQRLRDQASVFRRHAAHLNQLTEDFLPYWTKNNPNTCPTCGQDHGKRGGIKNVINDIQKKTEEQLASWEKEEKTLSKNLSNLEARLASLGLCPISDQRQRQLQELLSPFTRGQTLSSSLQNVTERASLKARLKSAQTLPDIPRPFSDDKVEEIAKGLAERSLSLDAQAERLWPLPERWSSIVAALKQECDHIVANHLPETLQRLWLEIFSAMTSARWNLATKPMFQVRDQGKVMVGVAERPETPARYLFNQAEQHIMGLAWFVVRYLTHGRFHHSVLVLDDPAQEMDQTTFRSFARIVQALLRLHEMRRLALQVIMFLHQEDRALDLARATLGRFIMLTWRKSIVGDDRDNIWEVRLLSEGFLPPKAIVALTRKAAAPS